MGKFFSNDNSLDNEMSKKDIITLETGQCLSPVMFIIYSDKARSENLPRKQEKNGNGIRRHAYFWLYLVFHNNRIVNVVESLT